MTHSPNDDANMRLPQAAWRGEVGQVERALEPVHVSASILDASRDQAMMLRMGAPLSRLEIALDQVRRTRAYTLLYLQKTDLGDWFRVPPGCHVHIGWQVGHLAAAEHFLLMQHIRGDRPGDAGLVFGSFWKLFGRGTTPSMEAGVYPPPEEILGALHRVHEAAMAELARLGDEELDRPPVRAHDLFDTKLGAILWCARHEMLHTGKIGLIRRMLGLGAVR